MSDPRARIRRVKISAGELNRATLSRQLLLERADLSVPEAVRRVVALQAQQPASPYVALWNRLRGFAPAELDAAFAERQVAKATLMRITLHAVHAADYAPFRKAMQPTLYASRLGGRFAEAGLTAADAHALVPELLAFAAQPRTSAEMQAWVAERLGAERKDGAWWGLKGYAPLHHAPTPAPWSFGHRPSFVRADPALLPGPGREPDADALRTLVLRHLAGFGPASVADVARFAMLPRTPVRAALKTLEADLVQCRLPDGSVLFDLPDAPRPPADTPAPPRLMAMWDSTLLAYADRSRVLPPAYRPLVIRANGDVLPTLLVDGRVAGVWRPADDGTGIEATAFHPLSRPAWTALAAEADSLRTLLDGRETRPVRAVRALVEEAGRRRGGGPGPVSGPYQGRGPGGGVAVAAQDAPSRCAARSVRRCSAVRPVRCVATRPAPRSAPRCWDTALGVTPSRSARAGVLNGSASAARIPVLTRPNTGSIPASWGAGGSHSRPTPSAG